MAESNTPAPQDPSKLKIAGPKVAEAPVKRPLNWTTIAAGLFLVGFASAGGLFIWNQAKQDIKDETADLQVEMSLILESRAFEIEAWLDQQFGVLQEIASNESQKIYIDTLLNPDAPAPDKEGSENFLRNYLKRMAEDNDFVTPPRKLEINANVVRDGIAGLAILNPDGQVMVGSEFVPAFREDAFQDAFQKNKARSRGLWDMHLDRESQPSLGFVVPIYPVDAKDGAQPIAYVAGKKQVAKELYPLLQQPGEPDKSADIFLARIKPQTGDATVEYLSPRVQPKPNGLKAFSGDEPNDPEKRATAFAIAKPGGFATRLNYVNIPCVVGGTTILGTPWTLVRTVDVAETTGPIQTGARQDLISFGLLLGIAVVSMGVAWKHGAEIRASAEAQRLKIAAERFTGFSKFLRVITDNQPTAIAAVDGGGKYSFANRTLAEAAGITPEEVAGKTMPAMIGPGRAAAYQKTNKQVIDDLYPGWPADRTEGKWQPQKGRFEFEEGGKKKYTKTDHIPLRADRDHPPGVLLIEQDITEFIVEREKRERMFRGLIEAFVGEVDSRQAQAARTNARLIGRIARGAAEEMGLSLIDVETAELAGELMNLGTMALPNEVVGKGGSRSDEEKQRMRQAILRSADLIGNLEFQGPVAETIRQAQERADGSGFPNRLAGDAILPSAKVVAVAKRLVDLIQGQEGQVQSLDQALRTVMSEAGASLDRGAVAAMVDFLDNRGGRAKVGLA